VSGGLLPILILMFLVMWLVVIRPQRRKQSEQQRMLDAVAPGAQVLTAGGMYGTVRAVDGDDVRVEIAPGVEIRMSRRAISAVIPEQEGEVEELERLQREAEAEVHPVGAGESSER